VISLLAKDASQNSLIELARSPDQWKDTRKDRKDRKIGKIGKIGKIVTVPHSGSYKLGRCPCNKVSLDLLIFCFVY